MNRYPRALVPFVLAGLATATHPGSASTQQRLSADQWRADLDQMAAAIEEHHFRPFHRVSEEAFDAAVEELREEIPTLTDAGVVLSMAEIVALLGDAHTRLALPRLDPALAIPLHGGHGGTPPPRIDGLRLPNLPVQLGLFDDGLYVTATVARLERLRGARVEAFDDVPADSAVRATRRLAFADNEQTARWYAPDRLALPHALAHLGLAPDPERVPVTFLCTDGERETLTLSPVGREAEWVRADIAGPPPLARRHPGRKRWAETIASGRAVYVQMDQLELHPPELTTDWLLRAVKRGEEAGAGRLILDLRANFGGSSSWNEAIAKVLARSPYNDYGRLFVLVGRGTFSAAQQLVQELEVGTQAIFVGEPTGSRPGHFGDPETIRLAHSGLTLRVSTLYWSSTFSGDVREAVHPHLPVSVTGSDHFAGRDPVLDAALRHEPPPGVARQVEDLLRRGRTQNAVIHFHRVLLDPAEDHDVVAGMAAAGHRLLDDGLLEEGRTTFVLAADYLPASSRAQAGLGRALEMLGECEAARRRYERARELDPANDRAREGLERPCGEP